MLKQISKFAENSVILALACAGVAQAATVDVGPRLARKAEMRKLYYAGLRPFLVDRNVQQALQQWMTHPSTQTFLTGGTTEQGTDVPGCLDVAGNYIRSAALVGPFCYLVHTATYHKDASVQEDAARRAGLLLQGWLKNQELVLEEISEDPKYVEIGEAQRAARLLGLLKGWLAEETGGVTNSVRAADCVAETWPEVLRSKKNGWMAIGANVKEFGCYRGMPSAVNDLKFESNKTVANNTGLAAADLSREFYGHPGHPISGTGWIPGNKVTYLTKLKLDFGTRDKMQAAFEEINWPVTYSLEKNGAGTIEKMQERIQAKGWQDVFTEPGFFTMANHPALDGTPEETQIFYEIFKAVGEAKKQVFIDVFFLGGTLGAALSKHIIAQLEAKPDLKVVVLKDMVNNYDYKSQMWPVMNFLRAYGLLHPGRLLVAPSHIKSHVPGIPQVLADAVTDSMLEETGLQEHLSLYGRAMSDHSKVIAVDAYPGSQAAKVFVGSKNLTDSSGGWAYDEVAMAEGPVALTVMDNYFEDIAAALYYGYSSKELQAYANEKPMLFKDRGSIDVPTLKRSSGEAAKALAKLKLIVQVMQKFGVDFLGRTPTIDLDAIVFEVPTVTKAIVTDAKGSVPIRVGENNFDSSIASCVDQVIHNILFAKERVRIADQYLFDENITEALKRAYERSKGNDERSKGNVDFRAILESYAENPGMIETYFNMPNQIYVDQLINEAGGRIKWNINRGSKDIHQEYHMKTTSVDGRVLIAGSANKDRNTMYGAFRETQLEIFDASAGSAAKVHDAHFDEFWNSSYHTSNEVRPFTFEVPEQLKGKISPEGFILMSRAMLRVLYGAETRAMD